MSLNDTFICSQSFGKYEAIARTATPESEEVVGRNFHWRSWFHHEEVEEVGYKGFYGGGFGDFGEGGVYVGGVSFDEVEGFCGEACDGGGGGGAEAMHY